MKKKRVRQKIERNLLRMPSGVRPGEQPVTLQMKSLPEEAGDGGSATTVVNHADHVFKISDCSHLSLTVDAKSLADLKQENTERVVRGLLEKTRRDYLNSKSWMFRLPWMKKGIPLEDFQVDLTIQEENRSRTFIKNRNFPYKEIFGVSSSLFPSWAKKSPPKTILLLGPAGYGKSTLATKIVYDWAKGRNNSASGFRVVILCRLRDVDPNADLESYLLDCCAQAMRAELGGDVDVADALRSIREQILLILDGHDEICSELRSSVKYLLSGDSYFRPSTVMVTSRPDDLDKDFESLFERQLTILPLSVKSRNTLIDKAFPGDKSKAQLAKTHFRDHKIEWEEMSPLILYCLCYVFEERGRSNIFDRADLIYEVSKVMFRRAALREELPPPDDKTLDAVILRLGKLFMDMLQKSRLTCKARKLANAVGCDQDYLLKIGLFQMRFSESVDLWETIHKVFMEELAVGFMNHRIRGAKNPKEIRAFLHQYNFFHSKYSEGGIIVFDTGDDKVVALNPGDCHIRDIVYVYSYSQSPYDGTVMCLESLQRPFQYFICVQEGVHIFEVFPTFFNVYKYLLILLLAITLGNLIIVPLSYKLGSSVLAGYGLFSYSFLKMLHSQPNLFRRYLRLPHIEHWWFKIIEDWWMNRSTLRLPRRRRWPPGHGESLAEFWGSSNTTFVYSRIKWF